MMYRVLKACYEQIHDSNTKGYKNETFHLLGNLPDGGLEVFYFSSVVLRRWGLLRVLALLPISDPSR